MKYEEWKENLIDAIKSKMSNKEITSIILDTLSKVKTPLSRCVTYMTVGKNPNRSDILNFIEKNWDVEIDINNLVFCHYPIDVGYKIGDKVYFQDMSRVSYDRIKYKDFLTEDQKLKILSEIVDWRMFFGNPSF